MNQLLHFKKVIPAVGIILLIISNSACRKKNVGTSDVPLNESKLKMNTHKLGDPEATYRFWVAANKIEVSGTGVEVLKKSSFIGDESNSEIASIFRDIAQAESDRGRLLASLPLLGVDSVLTTRTLEMVKLHQGLAQTLTDSAGILDEYAAALDADKLIVGFLLEAGKQYIESNDKQVDLASVAKGEYSQLKTELKPLAPRLDKLKQQLDSQRASLDQLNNDEMNLRLFLTQSYGREFGAGDSFQSLINNQKTNVLSQDFVMESLNGKSVGNMFNNWDFKKETQKFTSFELLGTTNRNDGFTDYYLKVHVKGIINEEDMNLKLTYRPMVTRLKLVDQARY